MAKATTPGIRRANNLDPDRGIWPPRPENHRLWRKGADPAVEACSIPESRLCAHLCRGHSMTIPVSATAALRQFEPVVLKHSLALLTCISAPGKAIG